MKAPSLTGLPLICLYCFERERLAVLPRIRVLRLATLFFNRLLLLLHQCLRGYRSIDDEFDFRVIVVQKHAVSVGPTCTDYIAWTPAGFEPVSLGRLRVNGSDVGNIVNSDGHVARITSYRTRIRRY